MKLEILTYEEYLEFAKEHPYTSIYQYPNWGELKKQNGWDYYLVGLKDNKKLVGATLLLRKKVIANLYLFYAPRGYLIDSKDKDLLTEFHNQILQFIKEKKGFMLKIDPNVILNIRNNNGDVISSVGESDFNNYCSLGYKYFGFTLNFETMQPRYLCRYQILNDYENTFSTFSKSTQKNTKKAIEMGVECEKVGLDNVELFVSMLAKTAEDKHFVIRPVSYYKKMLELFPDELVYYVTYINTSKYFDYVNTNIENTKKKLSLVEEKIEKYANVGNKLKHELEVTKNSLKKYEEELEYTTSLKNEGDKVYVGALMSVFTGDEGITFSSGTDNKYKKFNIKYAFYNEHLKESIKRNMKYVNFYGISGNMDPKSEYYNIYELKKGYNPDVIELLGEFDYIISNSKYIIYNVALKIYKLLKKIKNLV